MKEQLSVLIEILETQRSLQTELVELSESKTRAIGSGNGAELQRIVDEEQAILAQIMAVEKKQSQCAQRLSKLIGVPEEQVCMSVILDHAQGTQRETLLALRSDLGVLIERQQKHNDVNMRLLKMNLDYMQFLINSVSKQEAGPTYGNAGNIQKLDGSIRRMLDRKV